MKRKHPVKKLCLVNPTYLIRRPIAELIGELSDKHNISLLLPIKNKLELKWHSDKHIKKAKIITFKSIPLPGPFELPLPTPAILPKCWKVLKSNDIIHIWTPFAATNLLLIFMKCLFFREKKLILTIDTFPAHSFSMGKLDPFFRLFYKTLGKTIFSCVDLLTIYGKSFKKHAIRAGAPEQKLKIVPTGTNTKTKKPTKNIRKEFNIKPNQKIVLFAGLLIHRKGVDTLLKIAEKFENIKFLIVGDGPNKKLYQKIINKKSLDNVIITGFRKDIHNFYQQSDIFLLPSRGEGFAGVLMEAMAYKLPIITSKIAGTIDLIKHRKNGFLCKPENINDYKNKINKLLKSKKLSRKLAKNGLKRIKRLSWKKQAKKYEELYKCAE